VPDGPGLDGAAPDGRAVAIRAGRVGAWPAPLRAGPDATFRAGGAVARSLAVVRAGARLGGARYTERPQPPERERSARLHRRLSSRRHVGRLGPPPRRAA